MNGNRLTTIFVGGVLGSVLRYAVVKAMGDQHDFVWSIFIVNIVGCAVLGALLAIPTPTGRRKLLLHDFGGIGFCGGLTTFSTFAVDIVDMIDANRIELAALYATSSVTAGITAMLIAAKCMHRVRGLTQPLEGK